jgi:hypothetical protein
MNTDSAAPQVCLVTTTACVTVLTRRITRILPNVLSLSLPSQLVHIYREEVCNAGSVGQMAVAL